MARRRLSLAPSSTVHVTVPVASVIAWQSSLPIAANHTAAPEIGTPSLLNVALRENTSPLPTRTGAATSRVLGA